MSNASNVSCDVQVNFEKISNGDELNSFEKSIDDKNYRKKLIDYFSSLIGSHNAGEKSIYMRTVAPQLDRKMFTDSFWQTTAWTGGRKTDGPKKFVFAKHTATISFMNDVIRQICGTPFNDSEFAGFVKSRTRNSGYVRTSNRQTAARTPRPEKDDTDTPDQDPEQT